MNVAKKYSYPTLFLLAIVSLAVLSSVFTAPHSAYSQSADNQITGYAWSDTIGWIDLNCLNTGVCGNIPFGLSVDGSGNVTGYAWSDNIGWVSANPSDLAGCPSGSCAASLQNGVLSGWLRALSGGTAQSGGWDGFISLSGPNYGVTQTNEAFSGFAWGDINVGWTDFEYARTNACGLGYTMENGACTFSGCPENYTQEGNQCVLTSCPLNSTLEEAGGVPTCVYTGGPAGEGVPAPTIASWKVTPLLIKSGGTTDVSWSAENVASCSVAGTNGDSWSGASGTETSSPIIGQTIYALTCTGEDGSTIATSSTVSIVPTFQEK